MVSLFSYGMCLWKKIVVGIIMSGIERKGADQKTSFTRSIPRELLLEHELTPTDALVER